MKMTNFMNWLSIAFFATILFSCETKTEETTDVTPTATLKVTQASEGANLVTFKVEGVSGTSYKYEFGDGSSETLSDASVSHNYLLSGTYDARVIITTVSDAIQATATINVTKSDTEAICADTLLSRLAGGCGSNGGPGAGKVWKLSIAAGSHGVGPADAVGPDWWSSAFNHWAGNNGESLNFPEALKSRYTFGLLPNAFKVAATHQINNWQVNNKEKPFFDTEEVNALTADSYPFEIKVVEDKVMLTISEGGFLGYYQDVDGGANSKLEVVALTETELLVRYLNVLNFNDGDAKAYRYLKFVEESVVEEDQSEPAPEPFKGTVTEIPLDFKFEGADAYAFTAYPETGWDIVADPKDTGNKVAKLTKSAKHDSKVALDLSVEKKEFDFSNKNTITMKVFLPSSNDYATVDAAASAWGDRASNKFEKKIDLTFYDQSFMQGNEWQTEMRIVATIDKLDEWVTLTFNIKDFVVLRRDNGEEITKDGASLTDYDKLAIQVGGEGHGITGAVYIDDIILK